MLNTGMLMLTELQIRKFTKLFTIYDSDNSGLIDLADFERITKELAEYRGWKLYSEKFNAIFSKFAYSWIHLQGVSDKNRDNKVSLEEWLNYYEAILRDSQRYEAEISSLVSLIFDVFDIDGDGTISSKEWIDFLAVYNNHRIYAEKAFARIDNNKDGFITKEEFLKALYDFHYSDDPEALGNSLFIPY